MSKRFIVTLPDNLGRDLEAWAEVEGSAPGTIAGQIVTDAIREAKSKGLIPDRNAQILKILVGFIASGSLDDQEITILAHDIGLPDARLKQVRECLKHGDRKHGTRVAD